MYEEEGKVLISKEGEAHMSHHIIIVHREKKSAAYSTLMRGQGAHHACSYSHIQGHAAGRALGNPVP